MVGFFTKAALVVDALCLGPHWVYDPGQLAQAYPQGVYRMSEPLSQYHPGCHAGDLTHYGDQLWFFQQELERNNGFDLDSWRNTWLSKMADYQGYIDGATREALASKGHGSQSNDLAGVSRIAALLDLGLPLEQTVAMAREETTVAYGHPVIADVAEFFVRTVDQIQQQSSFANAFRAASQSGQYEAVVMDSLLDQVDNDLASSTSVYEVATAMGTSCHMPEALPLVLYLAQNNATSFADAMSTNALLGGDNAARGMVLALLFVARDGDVGAELFDQLSIAKQ